MKHIPTKKIMSLLLVVALIVASIGTLAYFTDRTSISASFTTSDGGIDIDTNGDKTDDPSDDPAKDLVAEWENNNPDAIDDPIAPGDTVDLGYELTNTGDYDIDVRQTFILTSDEAMDATNPEYGLFKTVATDVYGGSTGTAFIDATVERLNANQWKYSISAFTLKKGESKDLDYTLVFDKYASNLFQGDSCTVEYLVEMRQHVDSIEATAGWDSAILTAEITFGGNTNYKTVPAAA